MYSPLQTALLVALYYAPVVAGFIRWRRDRDVAMHPLPIFLIVTFLGWTIVGWFVGWIFALFTSRNLGGGPGQGAPIPLETSGTEANTPWSPPRETPNCYNCGGSAVQRCTSCNGQRPACGACHGTGRMTCQSCLGSGKAR